MTASDPPADDRSVPRTVLAWGLAGLIPFLGLPLLAICKFPIEQPLAYLLIIQVCKKYDSILFTITYEV